MGKGAGTEEMEWKDVSGQNHHAKVYGTPELVWDDTFPDGVNRKAVHFKPSDSIDFPDQTKLSYDYSVFAVAGYKKRQDAGQVFKLIGEDEKIITRGYDISGQDIGLSQLDLPYSYTIDCDLQLDSRVNSGAESAASVVFVLAQKGVIAAPGRNESKAPAVLFHPKNDTLIVIDGDHVDAEADCSMMNFPLDTETHLEIQIRLEKMIVKVDGTVVCNVDREDRSQSKGLLEQNAAGRFLIDAQLNLGGGHHSYQTRAAATGKIRNFQITSHASVGTWGRIFQASDNDWYVVVYCIIVTDRLVH